MRTQACVLANSGIVSAVTTSTILQTNDLVVDAWPRWTAWGILRQRDQGMTPTIANRLESVADLCGKHHVRRLALFGSAATGRFDPETGSDVDLLVDFFPMSPREHANCYFSLLEDLERVLGVPVDLVEPRAVRNPYFKQAIGRTQVVLFEAA